jgi:hypothetical protein
MKLQNILKSSKYIATTATLILLSGGACYELPQTYDSKDFSAAQFLSTYEINESASNSPKCTFSIDKPRFSVNSKKNIQLTPPAQVNFEGKPLNLDRATQVPCLHRTVEFVLIDNRGTPKSEKFNLGRVKLSTAKVSTDRSTELRIPILEMAYPQDTNFEVKIDGVGQDTSPIEVVSVSKKYPQQNTDNPAPSFDTDTNTLILPPHVLKAIPGKTAKLKLLATVGLYTKYPDDVGSFNSFTYRYSIAPISIQLK